MFSNPALDALFDLFIFENNHLIFHILKKKKMTKTKLKPPSPSSSSLHHAHHSNASHFFPLRESHSFT